VRISRRGRIGDQADQVAEEVGARPESASSSARVTISENVVWTIAMTAAYRRSGS
jgi:hypothetical protein